jgi:hypothetical protein
VGAAAAAVALAGVPAYAGTISTPPTNPFTVPLNAAGTGPAPFEIVASGYSPGTSVFVMICDGESPSTLNWSPTVNCDNGTSPQQQEAMGASGTATWNPAVSKNQDIFVFDGESPGDQFNCYYPGELDNGVAYSNGQIDPSDGLPSWTNCQIRVASTDAAVTTDQVFATMTLPAPAPVTPETKYTFLLPIGAVVLLGGSYLVLRRRRRSATPASA